MFMKLHRIVADRVVVDTTAILAVRKIYEHLKYQTNSRAWDCFFPIRQTGHSPIALLFRAAHHLWNRGNPPGSMRVVTDPSEFELEREFMVYERLEKRVNREFLQWYCATPTMRKLFVGCLNKANQISSYLILVPDRFKGIKAVTVVDDFTTQPNNYELLDLVAYLASHPSVLGLDADVRLLVWRSYEEGIFGKHTLGTVRRERTQPQWFRLPPAAGLSQKRFSVAEGDWGC
jgi:hypothetical protein